MLSTKEVCVLPYDETINLFERLSRITRQMDNIIETNDLNTLSRLLTEHRDVMETLDCSEVELDAAMKPVIEDADRNVRSVIEKIHGIQADIKKELLTMNKKKLIQSAYSV